MTKSQKILSALSALPAFTVGAVAGHHIDDIIEKYNLEIDRYPVAVEYNIINNCLSNYEEPLSHSMYGNKQDICICSLEATELEYDYASYKLEKVSFNVYDVHHEYEFLNLFEKNAEECM